MVKPFAKRQLAVAAIALMATNLNAAVALVTVPNDAFGRDGNFFTPIPFGYDDACDDGMRYQQVMLGSEIGSGNIDSIRFRLDDGESVSTGPVTYGGITVSLSSTFAGPTTISTRFADNIGPDATVVFSGDLTTESNVAMGSPFPFGFEIPVNAPFMFDGSQANLLLDITITVCHSGPTFLLDAEAGPTMGRQFARDKDDEFALPPIQVDIGLVPELVISTPPPLPYSRGLGGNWTIVGHDGEGFMIDVLPDGRIVVFWFTYDEFGNQVWLLGIGDDLIGDESTIELVRVTGPQFGPDYDPADQMSEVWGSIVIEFFDCNSGEVSYLSDVGFGAGTYAIERVYTTEQSSCPN